METEERLGEGERETEGRACARLPNKNRQEKPCMCVRKSKRGREGKQGGLDGEGG